LRSTPPLGEPLVAVATGIAWNEAALRQEGLRAAKAAGLGDIEKAEVRRRLQLPQDRAAVPDRRKEALMLELHTWQPVLLAGQSEYGMFEHFRRYPWVLPEVLYDAPKQLAENVDALVIAPAEAKIEARRIQK
jgi:hypothetical protein